MNIDYRDNAINNIFLFEINCDYIKKDHDKLFK